MVTGMQRLTHGDTLEDAVSIQTREGEALSLGVSRSPAGKWMAEHGAHELESLCRAILLQPVNPVLIADDNRTYRHANAAASRLLGLPPDKIIGRRMDDFADPSFQPQLDGIWREVVAKGEKAGTMRLTGPGGASRPVEFLAKASVLPMRHVVALAEPPGGPDRVPAWVQDFALMLLDSRGTIVSWYSGAARIYGYTESEAVGRPAASLLARDNGGIDTPTELDRCIREGHFVHELWQLKKDGSRFWANIVTAALRDENQELQGFARIVRDFTERHERDEKLLRIRARHGTKYAPSGIAGLVSGEFGNVLEANDAFLEMVGYTREQLHGPGLPWAELTPPEYLVLDDLAHEESLRFGACTPYEKELIRQDGSRVPVMVTSAVLKLSPFRWIAFIQDLRERDRFERVEEHVDAEPKRDFVEIVGTSAALSRVQRQVEVVAPTNANVLILGETGTGKELVARAIHRLSARRDQPFVTLNCAAIPTGLLESELFGYERGAFTGALSQKIGRFEMAHRGTLFLDEVGDIPLDLQPKLLRALQEKSFERLGGTKTIPIDVRLVAATNRNLTQMMGDKLFRSDLYYRLKVFPIITPPLRDHPEDIPILARHFTKKYAAQMGRQIDRIPAETMRALTSWPWPGNVRELENFIERSVILSRGPNLRAPLGELRSGTPETAGDSTLVRVERDHILHVLTESGGVVSKAAARLGMPRTTLNATMRKLGISRKDF